LDKEGRLTDPVRLFVTGHRAKRRRCCSIRSWEVSHSELDLTVGKLPPFLDNRHVPDLLTWLTEDFASFATGRVDRQRKYFWLPRAVHPVCQIAGANEHVRLPSCSLRRDTDPANPTPN